MAFSPDGEFALSGSGGRIVAGQGLAGDDYSLRLWRLPEPSAEDESESPSATDMDTPPAIQVSDDHRVTDYREIHHASLAELKTWLEALPADFRPTSLTSAAGAQPPRFNAVAVRDGTDAPFDPRLELVETDYNAMFDSGWAMRLVCTYSDKDKFRRHHIWVKDGHTWWVLLPALSQIKERFGEWKNDGRIPTKYFLNYVDRGRGLPERPYGVLLQSSNGEEWQAHVELGESELKDQLGKAAKDSLRPAVLDALGVGENLTFSLTLVPNPSGLRWEYGTYPTTAQFEAACNVKRTNRLRPLSVMSEVKDESVCYRVLWAEYFPAP